MVSLIVVQCGHSMEALQDKLKEDHLGAVFNPAVSFGPSLFSFIDPQVVGANISSSDFFIYYLISGIIGSVIASYLYKKVYG